MRRWLYLLCLAAMLGLLAHMNMATLPRIQDQAQGLVPFDLRSTGYTEAEARAFLAALSPEGRALYLGLQHRLDTVYPLLLALVLCWSFLRLLPRHWALGASAVAVLGAMLDLTENALVTRLLTDEAPTAALIAWASRASLGKSVVVSLALFCLTLALLRALWGRCRAR